MFNKLSYKISLYICVIMLTFVFDIGVTQILRRCWWLLDV